MKISIVNILAIVFITLILAGCDRGSDISSRPVPKLVSLNINSPVEAFNTILTSNDRNTRYTATIYLRQQTNSHVSTIKAYGDLLFRVHDENIRKWLYESMGWFGGTGSTSLLTAYLIQEEKLSMKMEIVHALGEIGPDAKDALPAIRRVSSLYARLADEMNEGGKVIIQDRNGEQRVEYEQDDKALANTFQQVARNAISKIQAGVGN